MIEDQLRQLGLGDYEAKIYAVLLNNSPAGATLIAKKCNLSRSSVYTTLHSLTSKGLVGTTYKNEIKQFVAQDFGSLQQLMNKEKESIEKKLRIMDTIKNEMEALTKQNINIPNIIFFEGKEGLKKIYMSMMRQSSPKATMHILRDEFVWQKEWQFVFKPDWHDRIKRIRREKQIKTQLLINRTRVEKQKIKFYKTRQGLDFKFLPATDSIKQFAVYIMNDVVSILSFENNNLVGIKITNQHLADNFRTIFGLLWKKSSK